MADWLGWLAPGLAPGLDWPGPLNFHILAALPLEHHFPYQNLSIFIVLGLGVCRESFGLGLAPGVDVAWVRLGIHILSLCW